MAIYDIIFKNNALNCQQMSFYGGGGMKGHNSL